ncbi:putative vesicle transport protein, Use1 [Helianthus annuus]|nr:putative vesicle transport protein, Use1 [Helianthus annuus]
MGLSRTEINLKRLLAAAPHQQNKLKLMHYVATLREQLEEIALERTPEGFPRVSKALVNDYSQKIEAIAANLASPVSDAVAFRELRVDTSVKENINNNKKEEESITSPGLRRRLVSSSSFRGQDTSESSDSSPVKLDAAAQTHISKHRKLQEDLTDEMVVLARQLKENSLKMNKSIQNTERILDSTEKAVEHSLATTGRVNTRATAMYSESFKTSCFTWFVMFVMICVFVMVVLLIKVT